METILIDIDQLLDATADLTSETDSWLAIPLEIDKLLENTKDW